MKTIYVGTLVILSILAIGGFATGCGGSEAQAGPYGGDVLPIEHGKAKAELVANPDTGEAMVHTWADDFKTPYPIEANAITIGSGDQSVELSPHPLSSDPPGRCSRFYGQADWMRGGSIRDGWMMMGTGRQNFEWSRCWEGGRSHGGMWSEMGEHRRMGMEHGQGQHH